jgi:uncharacterized LabA/DUF88 family protein
MKTTGNFAYIDNQNLYMATKCAPEPWMVDMRRLRVYLREKYNVIRAYLFMGAFEYKLQDRYMRYQDAGYILIFREHSESLIGNKKGNVDVDVVFEMMRDNFTSAQMERVVLVSGDGDYYRTIKYLRDMGKLEKVLLPSHKNVSSLYKELHEQHKAYLDTKEVRRKLGKNKGAFA